MQNIRKNSSENAVKSQQNKNFKKNEKNETFDYFAASTSNAFDLESKDIFFSNVKNSMGLSLERIQSICERINASHIRICFKTEDFGSIIARQYQNHKNLGVTENTKGFENALQRIKTEKELFGHKTISSDFLKRLSSEEKMFCDAMRVIFEIDLLANCNDNVESIEKKAIAFFQSAGFEFKDPSDPAPLYGLLQNETYFSIIKTKDCNDNSEIEVMYGKSALILNDKFKEMATICINDTFDLCPENFQMNNNKQQEKLVKGHFLCRLSSESGQEKIKNLLEKYLQSEISYFECQIHTSHIDITKENIEKIYISKSECKMPELEVMKICQSRGIPLEFVA